MILLDDKKPLMVDRTGPTKRGFSMYMTALFLNHEYGRRLELDGSKRDLSKIERLDLDTIQALRHPADYAEHELVRYAQYALDKRMYVPVAMVDTDSLEEAQTKLTSDLTPWIMAPGVVINPSVRDDAVMNAKQINEYLERLGVPPVEMNYRSHVDGDILITSAGFMIRVQENRWLAVPVTAFVMELYRFPLEA